jgi:hypothetical protein
MSATFPPGPYEISWRKTKHPSWELRAADGRILTSSTTIIPEDEIEALGWLLRAAPELLAACELLLAVRWDIGMHDSGSGVTHRHDGDGEATGCKWCIAKASARAAIAKARGGE